MAEEVQGSVTGGNGERLSFQVGTKSIGLTTRDLIPVLLLIILGVGGYLLYGAVSKDLGRLDRQHDQVLEVLQQNRLKIVEAIQEANANREEQTEAIRALLLQHEYNMNREPGDRLPLGLPPPLKDRERNR